MSTPAMGTVKAWQEAFDREETALVAAIAKGIADNLATAMRETGFGKDVARLAKLSGVSITTIREVLAGDRIAGPMTLNRIAYALGYRLVMRIEQAGD